MKIENLFDIRPNPIPMISGRIEKGGSDNVAIAPAI